MAPGAQGSTGRGPRVGLHGHAGLLRRPAYARGALLSSGPATTATSTSPAARWLSLHRRDLDEFLSDAHDAGFSLGWLPDTIVTPARSDGRLNGLSSSPDAGLRRVHQRVPRLVECPQHSSPRSHFPQRRGSHPRRRSPWLPPPTSTTFRQTDALYDEHLLELRAETSRHFHDKGPSR